MASLVVERFVDRGIATIDFALRPKAAMVEDEPGMIAETQLKGPIEGIGVFSLKIAQDIEDEDFVDDMMKIIRAKHEEIMRDIERNMNPLNEVAVNSFLQVFPPIQLRDLFGKRLRRWGRDEVLDEIAALKPPEGIDHETDRAELSQLSTAIETWRDVQASQSGSRSLLQQQLLRKGAKDVRLDKRVALLASTSVPATINTLFLRSYVTAQMRRLLSLELLRQTALVSWRLKPEAA